MLIDLEAENMRQRFRKFLEKEESTDTRNNNTFGALLMGIAYSIAYCLIFTSTRKITPKAPKPAAAALYTCLEILRLRKDSLYVPRNIAAQKRREPLAKCSYM
uniref:Uncharacterized protein n=1 Tax=Romanomermis culicivorax TaxID=13658 RepID=A0A915IKQ0_ROMCU